MKKLLAVLALLVLSTVSYAEEVVSSGKGIYIVDDEKVYYCEYAGCILVSSDYTKPTKFK